MKFRLFFVLATLVFLSKPAFSQLQNEDHPYTDTISDYFMFRNASYTPRYAIAEEWDEEQEKYIKRAEVEYIFNLSNHPVHRVFKFYDSDIMMISRKRYDSQNHLVESISQDSVQGVLINRTKYEFTYGRNGELESFLDYDWNTGSNGWVMKNGSYKCDLIYDSENRLIEQVYNLYDKLNWSKFKKITYHKYNERDEYLKEVDYYNTSVNDTSKWAISSIKDSIQWENTFWGKAKVGYVSLGKDNMGEYTVVAYKENRVYNDSGYVDYSLSSYKESKKEVVVNKEKNKFSRSYMKKDQLWVPESVGFMTPFESNPFVEAYTRYDYSGNPTISYDSTIYLQIFGENQQLEEFSYQDFDEKGKYGYRFKFYDILTNTSENLRPTIEINPNPVIDKLFIGGSVSGTYEIVNITGELVLSGNLKESSNIVDVSTIPTGIYFLKIMGDDINESYSRFIKN